jgi:hypothetical protein
VRWGYTDSTWVDLVKIGVPKDSCFPYLEENTQCPSKCVDGSQIQVFRSKNAYSVFSNDTAQNVRLIQLEILTNGPVEVAFWV